MKSLPPSLPPSLSLSLSLMGGGWRGEWGQDIHERQTKRIHMCVCVDQSRHAGDRLKELTLVLFVLFCLFKLSCKRSKLLGPLIIIAFALVFQLSCSPAVLVAVATHTVCEGIKGEATCRLLAPSASSFPSCSTCVRCVCV